VNLLRAGACVLLLSSAVASAAKPPATAATRKDDIVERMHGVDQVTLAVVLRK
jgi:hypothetical protein